MDRPHHRAAPDASGVMPPAVGGCTCAGAPHTAGIGCWRRLPMRHRPPTGAAAKTADHPARSGRARTGSGTTGATAITGWNSAAGKPTARADRSRPTRPGTRRLERNPAATGRTEPAPRRPRGAADSPASMPSQPPSVPNVVVDHYPLLAQHRRATCGRRPPARPRDPGKPEPSR